MIGDSLIHDLAQVYEDLEDIERAGEDFGLTPDELGDLALANGYIRHAIDTLLSRCDTEEDTVE